MTTGALRAHLGNAIWYPSPRPVRHHIPVEWQHWIFDRGSLTQRLMDASDGHFRVRILRQGWQAPFPGDRKALRLEPRRRALVREVELLGHDEPWVLAHSVIPCSTLSGEERALSRLGTRPLGAFLFKSRTMRRGPIEPGCLRVPGYPAIWGRRSVFYLSDKPLLVCEFFLPNLVFRQRM